MKRWYLFSMFSFLAVCGIYAQVQRQASIAWIKGPTPGADSFLCVFADTVEDVSLIDSELRSKNKALFLKQKEQTELTQVFKEEMEKRNARFMSLHIVQREFVEDGKGGMSIAVYYIIDIYERDDDAYYIVATNNY